MNGSYIEQSLDILNYRGYPWYAVFDDLPIEHYLRLFTKLSIYCYNNNIVEILKVSSVRI